MGKYPLTAEEKRIIIDRLEDELPDKRKVFINNAAAFASWLAGACYDIYIKVKGWITDLWEWLFG